MLATICFEEKWEQRDCAVHLDRETGGLQPFTHALLEPGPRPATERRLSIRTEAAGFDNGERQMN